MDNQMMQDQADSDILKEIMVLMGKLNAERGKDSMSSGMKPADLQGAKDLEGAEDALPGEGPSVDVPSELGGLERALDQDEDASPLGNQDLSDEDDMESESGMRKKGRIF